MRPVEETQWVFLGFPDNYESKDWVAQMQNRNKVSIIVVNWNGERLLNSCLETLCRQTYGEREIIVVDNGSTDSSVRFVRENISDVEIVELAENKGFTGGNIEG